MNEFGIQGIGVCVPEEGLDCVQLGAGLDASPEFIEQKLGFRTLRRRSSGQECSDLCVSAYEDLSSRSEVDKSAVDCVVVVTQNPDGGGIPHASALVHRKLHLPLGVACFDVSLGCTGYVHGLSVIIGFLRENGLRRGLLFTSDPYSRIIDPQDRDTVMLFGDAATCTLVSDRPRYRTCKTRYLTDSQWAEAIQVKHRGDNLQMDGNQVFRFVVRRMVRQIRECLRANECEASDIDVFLVHQGSRYIVDTLASSLKIPSDKIPFAAAETGNTISSSLPLMAAEQLSMPHPPGRVLLSGFGVGLAGATTVLNCLQET